jgi:hypothetical protein
MMARGLALLSVVLIVTGFAGGHLLSENPGTLALYHVGGLGVVALISSGAGAVASGKGYGFWPAFLLGLLPAVVLGLVVSLLAPSTGGAGGSYVCGGPVSLTAALLVLAIYGYRRRRDQKP